MRSLIAIAAPVLMAAAPAGSPVLVTEDAYAHAVVAHDRSALEPLLAPDLIYAHASGLAQNRDAYIEGVLQPGGIRGITFRSRTVHLAGSFAYIHGVVVYDMGQPRVARYTSLWRRIDGHWRLVLWQNTPLPDDKG